MIPGNLGLLSLCCKAFLVRNSIGFCSETGIWQWKERQESDAFLAILFRNAFFCTLRRISGAHPWVGPWISFVCSLWNFRRMSKGRRELWQHPCPCRRDAYTCRDWIEGNKHTYVQTSAFLYKHKWSMKLHHWVKKCSDLHCMWHLPRLLCSFCLSAPDNSQKADNWLVGLWSDPLWLYFPSGW